MKRLAEWYLGIPRAEPGQGTAWHVEYQPLWPAWLPNWLVLLVVLAVCTYVAGIYWRDAGPAPRWMRCLLIGLRLSIIALLCAFLIQPVLSIDRTGLPSVAVVVDDSASMGLEDQYADEWAAKRVSALQKEAGLAQPTRLNLAVALLARGDGQFLKHLATRQTLRVYRFSETAVPIGPAEYRRSEDVDALMPMLERLEPQGTQTRPGPAVRKILNDLRGTPPSAIIILTDGIASTGDADRLSTVSELALSQLVPLYPVGVGSAQPARDLNLYDLLVDEVALVDDPIRFRAKLKSYGYAGRTIELRLRQKDSQEVLASEQVELTAQGETVPVELTYTPTSPGEFDYTLEVALQPDETNTDNNSETRHISVREERIRVLLADSQPRYEFRYVKHLLERDKTIELKTVLQEAGLDYAREDATALEHFPVKREDLLAYDVIVFGDVSPEFLSAGVFENLREFVRDSGGGLILVAGPLYNPLAYRGTPLEVLLPIQLEGVAVPTEDAPAVEGFRPRLTLEGRKGSAIFRFAESEADSIELWNQLPELYWYCAAPELKPAARVLAEHPVRSGREGKLPIIAVQPYGAGKVLFHATDELWRWRFRLGDYAYGRYWVQAIRYLSRSKLLGKDRTAELTSARSVYQRGEAAQLRLRFLDERLLPAEDDGVKVLVEGRGGVRHAVTLNRLPALPTVFEGQASRLPEGTYHAIVVAPAFGNAPPTAEFRVEAPRQELERRSLDQADLQKAAQTTRGRYYTLADVEQLLADLPPGQPVPLESGEPMPLWNRWEALLLFTMLLVGEWLLRKKYRLI